MGNCLKLCQQCVIHNNNNEANAFTPTHIHIDKAKSLPQGDNLHDVQSNEHADELAAKIVQVDMNVATVFL